MKYKIYHNKIDLYFVVAVRKGGVSFGKSRREKLKTFVRKTRKN